MTCGSRPGRPERLDSSARLRPHCRRPTTASSTAAASDSRIGPAATASWWGPTFVGHQCDGPIPAATIPGSGGSGPHQSAVVLPGEDPSGGVLEAVMCLAQASQVVQAGAPALGPRADVVDIAALGRYWQAPVRGWSRSSPQLPRRRQSQQPRPRTRLLRLPCRRRAESSRQWWARLSRAWRADFSRCSRDRGRRATARLTGR